MRFLPEEESLVTLALGRNHHRKESSQDLFRALSSDWSIFPKTNLSATQGGAWCSRLAKRCYRSLLCCASFFVGFVWINLANMREIRVTVLPLSKYYVVRSYCVRVQYSYCSCCLASHFLLGSNQNVSPALKNLILEGSLALSTERARWSTSGALAEPHHCPSPHFPVSLAAKRSYCSSSSSNYWC